jgi:outer membrane protein OmpA-like peptidoglycan-associated protein
VVRAFERALTAEGFEILFNRRLTRQGTGQFGDQSAFRPLQDINKRTLVRQDGIREDLTNLQRIYYFPEYYLSAKRVQNGEEITFAVTITEDRDLYIMEQITQAAIEDGTVTFSEDTLSRGIETEGRAILYGVQFDVGSSVLRPSSKASVEIIAKVLRERPGNFYVVGHTSDTGGFQLNMDLSRDRAASIIETLGRDFGIDTSRLTPIGVGPAAPLASNQNEEGRALNRRVELVERLEN